MIWKTLVEWNDDRYIIMKGEKSILREPSGIPLFNDEQVCIVEDHTEDAFSIY